MQTERVTFLTTPGHKAALDAFARESGQSVGHVVREATSSYIAQDATEPDTDEMDARALVVAEAARVLPHMQADLEAIRASIAEARAAIAEALRAPAPHERGVAA